MCTRGYAYCGSILLKINYLPQIRQMEDNGAKEEVELDEVKINTIYYA
jgi:hypothetical protein